MKTATQVELFASRIKSPLLVPCRAITPMSRALGFAIPPHELRAAQNGHAPGELPPKPAANSGKLKASRGTALAYQMIAERENETVKIERESSLIIVAKARVWASEGWQVVITDADGKSYAPAEFDRLLAA
jgi:hypothetical protein